MLDNITGIVGGGYTDHLRSEPISQQQQPPKKNKKNDYSYLHNLNSQARKISMTEGIPAYKMEVASRAGNPNQHSWYEKEGQDAFSVKDVAFTNALSNSPPKKDSQSIISYTIGLHSSSAHSKIRHASSSHQLSAGGLLKRGTHHTASSSSETKHSRESSVQKSASKWFRRNKSRNEEKQKKRTPNPYQLDMNFSDLNEFVDLAKVRRSSVTSSLGTTESSIRAVPVKDEGERNSAHYAEGITVTPRESRKDSVSSRSMQRLTELTSESPSIRESSVGYDARSQVPEHATEAVRGSSASAHGMVPVGTSSSQSTQNTQDRFYPQDTRPSEFSGQIHRGSVGSVVQSDNISIGESFRAADELGTIQFTDPWAADRERQMAISASKVNRTSGEVVDRQSGTNYIYDSNGPRYNIPEIEYPPRRSEPWAPPESWAVLPTAMDGGEDGSILNYGARDPESDADGNTSDSDLENDTSMYSLRIYKEDSTFGTFHCHLSTTTAEFMQMAAKKFFIPDITRYCLYMQKANGLDRTLKSNERPANILKRYLEQMGYRPEDNITLQGREDNSYLCKFSLFKAAIPRVSPNMEVEVNSFHYVDLRARKLQTVPVFLYAHANKIVSLNMSKNPGLNFPADFVQLCDNLKELRLSTCQFTRVPNSIQYFTNLSFLDLSGNDMKRIRHAPFDKLRYLTTLMLRNNRLIELPNSLAELKELKVLNVSNNNFQTFPSIVTHIESLEDLDISLNRIGEIPNSISALSNLIRLNIMGNLLTEKLPDGIAKLCSLEELDVRQNKLQDLSVTSELKGLKGLYTEHNLVTRVYMELEQTIKLSLRANKLTHFKITNPAHTLVFLDLSRNQLTELPSDTFIHLPMLEHLILDSNHIVSIPSSVGNLSRLAKLSCTNNVLSFIPIELTRLENLQFLDLHNNNLKILPPEIWLMPKLSSLNLSSNLLDQFPHPSMLESIRRQQGISSSVRAVAAATAAAAAAAAQKNGVKDWVAGRMNKNINPISMSSPTTRQHSPMARGSSDPNPETGDGRSGSNGTLQGAMSKWQRNMSTDVGSVSHLTPPLPMKRYSISDPPPLSHSLRELRLGDNNLDDEVFTLMAFLPELRILNLSYNELYDIPPSSMMHMRRVTELYLSGTQISTIPEEEPNAAFWRNLRILNINGNKLQTLPSWLAKIHGLNVLDVGNNVLKYNITNWPYDWNWNWNTGLKYLNFSYNERFEIRGSHLHTKVFHDHANLLGNTVPPPAARDMFSYMNKEPPTSDCVSDFYQLTDLRILGLLQLTIMVPLPEETPNRRVRTTDPIKQVKYGIADSLGPNDRVSTWDLASSRFRMSDDECLFGLFHAHETSFASSAISKYLCDHFLYAFREELDKVSEQQNEENEGKRQPDNAEAPKTQNSALRSAGNGDGDGGKAAKKSVNFADEKDGDTSGSQTPSHVGGERVQAALRRTFLTLNKDLGTHNRQLIVAAAAAEAYAARPAREQRNTENEINLGPDGTEPGSTISPIRPITMEDHQGGATAVVAYIQGRTLHVANVGDALGVVSRRGNPIDVSKRHEPYEPSEMMRIRSMGGYITQQGKVQGQTDITRAFGYFHLLPFVNADPTIRSHELTEEDEFLIMANRPVWDAITPQTAIDIARKHRRDPRLAAARVRDHVTAYGAPEDSLMVMVIGFGPMFTKNAGRPARGFSVRDSVYPGLADHRTRYALTRRMSRSPSSAIGGSGATRTSTSHVTGPDGKPLPVYVPPGIGHPGAVQSPPLVGSVYEGAVDDFDEFFLGAEPRTRRQRERETKMRLVGDSTLARLEREVAPPVGEVALVFTDVKNSTIQWETNPVAMRSAIKVHNSIMRRMLRSIGGYEVKTEGDAFMVSFPTVASALHWCMAVQLMFLSADWPQEILDSPHGRPIYWNDTEDSAEDGIEQIKAVSADGQKSETDDRQVIYRGLRVRMGVHFGSPVSEEDPITRRMDYFGPMVNRASRVSGAADGGQVYVSQDVMDEVYAILDIFSEADRSGISDMRQLIDEPSLARDVQALKNLGLCALQVGEIKLKGLESPEFVSLVYPAALRGRVDMQVREEQRQREWAAAAAANEKASRNSTPARSARTFSPTSARVSVDESTVDRTSLPGPRRSSSRNASAPAGFPTAPASRRSVSLLQNYDTTVTTLDEPMVLLYADPVLIPSRRASREHGRGTSICYPQRQPSVYSTTDMPIISNQHSWLSGGIDAMSLEILYRIVYRLGILATESGGPPVVYPSFDYFAHREGLETHKVHRSSTISVVRVCSAGQSRQSLDGMNADNEVKIHRHLPIALNEPPIPLCLWDTMSQGHLASVLLMLIRQVECAVEVLERDSGVEKVQLSDVLPEGVKWTSEHVRKALEMYAREMKELE